MGAEEDTALASFHLWYSAETSACSYGCHCGLKEVPTLLCGKWKTGQVISLIPYLYSSVLSNTCTAAHSSPDFVNS